MKRAWRCASFVFCSVEGPKTNSKTNGGRPGSDFTKKSTSQRKNEKVDQKRQAGGRPKGNRTPASAAQFFSNPVREKFHGSQNKKTLYNPQSSYFISMPIKSAGTQKYPHRGKLDFVNYTNF